MKPEPAQPKKPEDYYTRDATHPGAAIIRLSACEIEGQRTIHADMFHENTANRTIDWSHRWEVMGHWMNFWKDQPGGEIDFSRIGKNRAGEYCVAGRTWRMEHEKGPENMPLVKKVRVIEGQPNVEARAPESASSNDDTQKRRV